MRAFEGEEVWRTSAFPRSLCLRPYHIVGKENLSLAPKTAQRIVRPLEGVEMKCGSPVSPKPGADYSGSHLRPPTPRANPRSRPPQTVIAARWLQLYSQHMP